MSIDKTGFEKIDFVKYAGLSKLGDISWSNYRICENNALSAAFIIIYLFCIGTTL